MTPEKQQIAVNKVFSANGFIAIDPPIIQPAEPFLDLSGEDIRRRIYVFTDPYGIELCLRPDLTIPTCLHYLTEGATAEKRYSYDGLAFRCQQPGSHKPNEFFQMGIELIGHDCGQGSVIKADAEVFGLTLDACQKAGLKGFEITMGDLGLFAAFIEALDIPQHWRARLRRNFWQPSRFGSLLDSLSEDRPRPERAATDLGNLDEERALETVRGMLDTAGLDDIPGRSLESVTRRLLEKARDASADPVSAKNIKSIKKYLEISGPPRETLKNIRALEKSTGIDIGEAIEAAEERVRLMEKQAGSTPVVFATEFGRSFEYYTGFVFELTVQGKQVAGGGRYDGLLHRLGASVRVPAVGAMIRNDRLGSLGRKPGEKS